MNVLMMSSCWVMIPGVCLCKNTKWEAAATVCVRSRSSNHLEVRRRRKELCKETDSSSIRARPSSQSIPTQAHPSLFDGNGLKCFGSKCVCSFDGNKCENCRFFSHRSVPLQSKRCDLSFHFLHQAHAAAQTAAVRVDSTH